MGPFDVTRSGKRSLRIAEPVILCCQVCGKRLARPGEVWLVGPAAALCPAHSASADGPEPEIILPLPRTAPAAPAAETPAPPPSA
jgi:hypothetical protein